MFSKQGVGRLSRFTAWALLIWGGITLIAVVPQSQSNPFHPSVVGLAIAFIVMGLLLLWADESMKDSHTHKIEREENQWLADTRVKITEEIYLEQLAKEWESQDLKEQDWLAIVNDESRVERGYIPKAMRDFVLERDNYTCVWCGSEGTTDKDINGETWQIDHIIPCSRGGRTVPTNLATTCRVCNNSKVGKSPLQFIHYLRRKHT